MVDLDKDGAAQLDGIVGVIVGVDGGGAAADIMVAFVNGDVDGLTWGLVLSEVVCGRCSCGSSTW